MELFFSRCSLSWSSTEKYVPDHVTVAIKKKPSADSLDYIYLEGERVSLEQLGERLIERKEAAPDMDVLIEADRGEEIDTLAKVLATVKSAGIESVGIATDPVSEIERPK